MNTPTGHLNKTQFAEAVARELGIHPKEGNRIIDAVLNTITRTVTAGHDVTITNFGTFRAVETAARLGYNPQTRSRMPIPSRPGMRFRVSPRLREVVQGGNPGASIRKRPSK